MWRPIYGVRLLLDRYPTIGDKVLSSDALLRNLELCYYNRDHLVICMVEISLFPLDLREFKL